MKNMSKAQAAKDGFVTGIETAIELAQSYAQKLAEHGQDDAAEAFQHFVKKMSHHLETARKHPA